MAYAYAPEHMPGMTGAYPSLTMLSGIDVEGDLEFNHASNNMGVGMDDDEVDDIEVEEMD